MRAAYLLAASFLRSQEATSISYSYATALIKHRLPQRAIEPLRFVLTLPGADVPTQLLGDAHFRLATCLDTLSRLDELLAAADQYLAYGVLNDLPDHATAAWLFKIKALAGKNEKKAALSALSHDLLGAENLRISALNAVAAFGDTVRTEGLHDGGIAVLLAFSQQLHAPSDQALLAMTLSEVGYTFLNIGDGRGIEFLADAVQKRTDETLQNRWRQSGEIAS